MFNFGAGQKTHMSKRWNDIESTLRGDQVGRGGHGRNQTDKKGGPKNKLTNTQQKFGRFEEEKIPSYARPPEWDKGGPNNFYGRGGPSSDDNSTGGKNRNKFLKGSGN